MQYSEQWSKILGISCTLHFALFLALGLVLGKIAVPVQPVRPMMIEMSVSQVQPSVKEPAPRLPEAALVVPAVPLQTAAPVTKPSPPETAYSTNTPEQSTVPTSSTGATAAEPSGLALQGPTAASPGSGTAAPQASATQQGNSDAIIQEFIAKMERYKEYPYLARRRGQEGTTVVAVRIGVTGELAALAIVRSSGIPALDEAAEKLVRRICPFPHSYGGELAMRIPIAYRLE